MQGGPVRALLEQEGLVFGIVLQIAGGLALGGFVEGRLGDVEIAPLDHLRHLAIEEGEQKGADVRPVHVGVGHDDDPVIADLLYVEIVPADAGAQRRDQGADLLGAQHLVEAGPLHVQHLAAQGQHGLVLPVAALLGGAAGGIPFHDEQFRLGGVPLLTVGQLAGQGGDVERRLAPGEFAGLPRGFPGGGGFADLADNGLGFQRMLLEPLAERLVHQALHGGARLGGDQLVLGLGGELGVGQLHRQDAGHAFPGVFARHIDLLPLGRAGAFHIGRDHPGQRAAEGGQVGAPVLLRDVVGEAQHGLVVAVVPPHGEVDLDLLATAADDDRRADHGGLGLVQVADERLHPALVVQHLLVGLQAPQVAELDGHTGIEEGQLPQPVLERLAVELDARERLDGGEKADAGAGQILPVLPPGGLAGDLQGADRVTPGKAHLVHLAVPPDLQVQPVGQRVHHRHAHPVQTAGDLVAVLVELPAGMQLGHDHLGGGDSLLGVDVGGNAPAVVGDGGRAVGIEGDGHLGRPARQHLVDGVVHHLVDHVMQAGAVVRVADIHARTLADGVQTLQDPDGIRAIIGSQGLGGGVRRVVGNIGHEQSQNIASGSARIAAVEASFHIG